MKTNIISVKYESNYAPKVFEGKSYSYYSNVDVNVGDLVVAPTAYGDKIARVSEINIPEDKIQSIKPYLKTITLKIDKEKYLQSDQVLEEAAWFMTGNEVTNILVSKLLDMGFIVHRYNSHSTSSIYLKLDFGLSCGIRIADHPGKKKYSYRFNVIKDYVGNKVILKDGLICRFYDFNELDSVLNAVQQEKQQKINKYGLENYQRYMEREKNENELFKRFKKAS